MLLSRSGTFSLCLADELLPIAVVAIFCYFCVAWEMDQLGTFEDDSIFPN